MLWSDITGCKSGKEVVSFFGKESNEIKCIESSDLEITGGDKFTHSFAVSGLRKDATNLIVIAVKLLNDKGHYCGSHCAFVEICFIGKSQIFEASLIDWVPSSADRIGVVDTEGFIKMRIDGKIFSTDPSVDDGIYFIGEENVCCNYLASRVTANEVVLSAEETQKQIDLQERCDELEKEKESISKEFAKLAIEVEGWRDKVKECMEINKGVQKEFDLWKKAATRLRDAVKSPLIKKRYGCSRRGGGFMFETRGARINEALRLFPDIPLEDRSLKSQLIIKE